MKYINLKYIGNGARRASDIGMGGFELEATTKIETLKATYRKGQLCKEFKLMIPPGGECKVPDTQFNREILRIHCSERTEKIHGTKRKMQATYELLSKIDLKEDSPNKPEIVYTQKELDKIVSEQSKGKLTQRDVDKAVTESTKGTFTQDQVNAMIAEKVGEAIDSQGKMDKPAPVVAEDNDEGSQAKQIEEMKKNRFANKGGAPDLVE